MLLPRRFRRALFGVAMVVAGRATAQDYLQPLPSPIRPSPGTQHTVGSITYDHSSFEADPSLITPQQSIVLYPESQYPVDPGPTHPPLGSTSLRWTWSGGGIAGNASGITAGSQTAGSFAAFLQSSAATGPVSFAFSHVLPNAGIWRISFRGAQRQTSSGVDDQVVRITAISLVGNQVMTEEVFNEPMRDAQYRQYYTRPFFTQSSTITLLFEGTRLGATPQTALIDMVNVREVIVWAEAATWSWFGFQVPTSTDDVVIPSDSCVGVWDGAANTVDLQGELFALDAVPQNSLSTRVLDVHGPGSYFQVGLEGRPYLGQFELVLDDDSTGSDPSVNGMMVHDDGVVEMHGKPKTSWLRLAANANTSPPTPPLTNTIIVDGVPNGWQAGDKIVIAGSDRDFNHAEQRTISITPGTGALPPRSS